VTIEGDGIFDVSIYDLTGKLLGKKARQRAKTTFDCSNWSSGTYFARIKLEGKILVNKLIKQ
jgi:hypothetical protein